MIRRGNMRKISVMAALAASVLALSSCAAAEGTQGSGGGASGKIKVGYFPLVHTSTAVNALEHKLFADKGLDVELVQTTGGAAAIPALISGTIDMTYANYTSALLAAKQGLPIKLVAGNDVAASDHGIFVAKGSAIKSVSDLAGKTFVVNNLQNIGTVAIMALLEDAGVNPAEVKLVEMPLPDMQGALERGAVDAIWQVEPFQASAAAAGLVKISDMFTGPVAGMPVAGWITTEKFAKDHPEQIKAFQQAIKSSTNELSGNRNRLVELVPTFTKVPAAVVEKIEIPQFQGDLEVEKLQKTADLMLKYKIIDSKMDVKSLLTD